MKLADALIQLVGVWYLVDDDIDVDKDAGDADANGRRFGVSRRNVLSELLGIQYRTNGEAVMSDLFGEIADNSICFEIHERHYAPSVESAYSAAEKACLKPGQISLDHLIKSFEFEFEFQANGDRLGKYFDCVKALSTALDMDENRITKYKQTMTAGQWQDILDRKVQPAALLLALANVPHSASHSS